MIEKSTSLQQKYADIQLARQAFREGKNVTETLKRQLGTNENSAEIIEIAYDLQAGSYIKSVEANRQYATSYTREMADILGPHLSPGDRLLDVGTGELTTLSLLVSQLHANFDKIYAFDISWSRIWKGLSFAQQNMGANFSKLAPFVGDINEIPLLSKSIDVVISSHALEPNGGREQDLLRELFRVTKKKLLLFEPCYEINSAEGKQRMDRLGYIKNLDAAVDALGGQLVEKIQMKNVANPLNPTVCYVIVPPASSEQPASGECIFSSPETNEPLTEEDGFFFSAKLGVSYPIIKGIPILRSNAAILTTALEG